MLGVTDEIYFLPSFHSTLLLFPHGKYGIDDYTFMTFPEFTAPERAISFIAVQRV